MKLLCSLLLVSSLSAFAQESNSPAATGPAQGMNQEAPKPKAKTKKAHKAHKKAHKKHHAKKN